MNTSPNETLPTAPGSGISEFSLCYSPFLILGFFATSSLLQREDDGCVFEAFSWHRAYKRSMNWISPSVAGDYTYGQLAAARLVPEDCVQLTGNSEPNQTQP